HRKLRMGLAGGAQGFIGRVHATAAILDNRAVLVAGALSSDAAKAKAGAPDFGIASERAYGSYHEMLAAESRLSANERIDFVSIATPNHTHFEIARQFAEAGFNVMCDKPMTLTLTQAEELAKIVRRAGVVFAVTHNYTGYPLVRQARSMVRADELGDINAVRACYIQGWLRRQMTEEQKKRRAWKMDPERTGVSGCIGDIGIHAYNLTRFITGLLPDQVSCHLENFAQAGPLDDYGTAILRFQNNALGTITASRVSHGRENGLSIEIDGTNGSLEWHQEEPNRMWLKVNGQPHRLYTRDPNAPFTSGTARLACRLPSGHPEGFIEAFANVYTAAFADIAVRATGGRADDSNSLYPNVADGVDGLNFVTQCVASSEQEGEWLSLKHPLCRG
ncbi:MAG TPA: Gfo/Idh/MocA family oxidoreductase, partial [Gemmataceae bacterium]|nr:Gfo/Idh/MocA family oxidoreductase [Gemmataceae bacterium]